MPCKILELFNKYIFPNNAHIKFLPELIQEKELEIKSLFVHGYHFKYGGGFDCTYDDKNNGVFIRHMESTDVFPYCDIGETDYIAVSLNDKIIYSVDTRKKF